MRKRMLRVATTLAAAAVVWAPAIRADDGEGSRISISKSSLSFSATVGGTVPAAQTFTVSASSATSFSISASVQNTQVNWLNISPVGNLYTNKTITVSVAPGSLSAGTYGGSIRVSSNGSTTTVPVTLVMSTSTTSSGLTVSPTSLAFSATAGGAAPASQTLSVSAGSRVAFTASDTANWLSVSPTGTLYTNTTLTVQVNQGSLAAGTYAASITLAANGTTKAVPVSLVVSSSTPPPPPPTNTGYKLLGWNDLGMHCFDGKDYSVFAVLPPYNTIHAHLIDAAGLRVKSGTGYTVTYQAITDPLTNTLNTTSIGKTNFWSYAAALGFGALAPDMGLKGNAMPGSGNTAQPMAFSATDQTFLAEGIPMTPYSDSGTTNYFPMMRLTAKNSNGTVLATTDIVLPTSDEMACATCHSSTSGYAAAQPSAGWVNNSDRAKDVKLNIMRKHDDKVGGSALFKSAAVAFKYSTSGLAANYPTTQVLCATCHASNALGLAGYAGIPPLTTAMHTAHGPVTDPATSAPLEAGTTRDSCYNCHPGSKTQCLRGAMATLKTATGANQIECQSCHGTMSTVATPGRQGWLEEPSCQNCHTGTATANNGQIAYTSVFASGTTQRVAVDQTFATTPNVPGAGLSLYRFSSGHGGLQCEACHNSTHAELTTPIVNDNVQSTNLQGHVGMVAECTACHASVPSTVNGGPHGLHPIGSGWVSQHQGAADSNRTQCQACHGTDYRGTILSKTKAARSMAGRSFPAGTVIGCYSCHNGPNGG